MTSRGFQICKNHFTVRFAPTDIAKYEYLYAHVTQYASGSRKYKNIYVAKYNKLLLLFYFLSDNNILNTWFIFQSYHNISFIYLSPLCIFLSSVSVLAGTHGSGVAVAALGIVFH